MKTIAFFNNKGGGGKTSLVYHLAWMFQQMNVPVLAADLDPQSNLTSMFLEDEQVEELLSSPRPRTISEAIAPLFEGLGDVAPAPVEAIAPGLGLLAGDLGLSLTEEELSAQWSKCVDGNPRAFRVMSSFWRSIMAAGRDQEASLVLIDVGPNLGALNRAALVSSDYLVVPLAPDLFSIQGLKNLGPTLKSWRKGWEERVARNLSPDIELPPGEMDPVGYVVMQHAVRYSRPVKAYARWLDRIPNAFRRAVEKKETRKTTQTDPYCLATIKHYRSLMAMAQEARKPMFLLKSADGALGGHAAAVSACYADFNALARQIAEKVGLSL